MKKGNQKQLEEREGRNSISMGKEGFIANPASGKDIRRFEFHGTVISNRGK